MPDDDVIIEIEEDSFFLSDGDTLTILTDDSGAQTELVEIVVEGPQGNPGVILLQASDPDPSPILDGVLYLRLTS